MDILLGGRYFPNRKASSGLGSRSIPFSLSLPVTMEQFPDALSSDAISGTGHTGIVKWLWKKKWFGPTVPSLHLPGKHPYRLCLARQWWGTGSGTGHHPIRTWSQVWALAFQDMPHRAAHMWSHHAEAASCYLRQPVPSLAWLLGWIWPWCWEGQLALGIFLLTTAVL